MLHGSNAVAARPRLGKFSMGIQLNDVKVNTRRLDGLSKTPVTTVSLVSDVDGTAHGTELTGCTPPRAPNKRRVHE